MPIGQAYSNSLTPQEQQALQASCDIETPKDIANTIIGGYLPPRYLYKYTPLFLRQFAVCVITVAWKLAQPQHVPLSSLAEELAARTIIENAKAILEDDENYSGAGDEEFVAFIDHYFEDTDFEYLYDDSFDGIDETDLAQMMGLSSLAFNDWFKPFSDEPSRTPHLYVVDETNLQEG